MNDAARKAFMTETQVRVEQLIEKHGGHWSDEKQLLHLSEECGELIKADRKGTKEEFQHELSDVIFTCICVANKRGMNFEALINLAIRNFKWA